MKQSPTLAQMQEFLRYTFSDPRGVKNSLKNKSLPHVPPNSRQRPKANLIEFISKQKPLSPEERLQVYADAYVVRILSMLESSFKFLLLKQGPHLFSKHVSMFLSQFQSKSWNIDEIAREFFHFIQKKFPEQVEENIAALEWTQMEVIFAKLENSGNLETKIHYFADKSLSQKVVLGINSTLKIVSLSHDFKAVLDRFLAEDENLDLRRLKRLENRQNFGFFRNRQGLKILPLLESEIFLLEGSQKGLALEEICRKLNNDGAEESAVANLGLWLENGLITDLKLIS